MSDTETWQSGKGHTDENFPVASMLVAKRHRPVILAFYRFARAADDAADHPTLPADDRRAILDRLDRTLDGAADAPEAAPLAAQLATHPYAARHARDLLAAFRLDVGKARYATFEELMDYCALSAMPVGRFLLDVHGEPRAAWPASDALCAALQIINHVQDCGRDFRSIDRVYMPSDILARHGASVEDLGRDRAPPALRAALVDVSHRAAGLMDDAARLPGAIADRRLRMETAVIIRLAERILARLMRHDPLSERVHLSRPAMLRTAVTAIVLQGLAGRPAAAARRPA
ncbi:MAG: squalene synthase HpnC [Acuticoccus sp.]